MAMSFCRGCGKEIHESASSCPHCGATQADNKKVENTDSKWMAITSLCLTILGALVIAVSLGDTYPDEEAVQGAIMFAFIGLVFGAVSLIQKRWGKGLSIGSLVLAVITILAGFGI